ncbi:MAG TPA: hypothetical protein VHF65_06530 [Nitrososphaera sp.]|nr:hypothetical protein [Nitrososphaera sp.]
MKEALQKGHVSTCTCNFDHTSVAAIINATNKALELAVFVIEEAEHLSIYVKVVVNKYD